MKMHILFLSLQLCVCLVWFTNARPFQEETDITWPDARNLTIKTGRDILGRNLLVKWHVAEPDRCIKMEAILFSFRDNFKDKKSSNEPHILFSYVNSDKDYRLTVSIQTLFNKKGIQLERMLNFHGKTNNENSLLNPDEMTEITMKTTDVSATNKYIVVLNRNGDCHVAVYNTGKHTAPYSIEATNACKNGILPAMAIETDIKVSSSEHVTVNIVKFSLPKTFLTAIGSFTPEIHTVTETSKPLWPPRDASAVMQLLPAGEASIRLSFRPSVTQPDRIQKINVEIYESMEMTGVPTVPITLILGDTATETTFTRQQLIDIQKNESNVFTVSLTHKFKLGQTYFIKMFTNDDKANYNQLKMILPILDSQKLAVVKAEKAVGGGITFTWGSPFLNDPEIHSFEVRAEKMNPDTPVEPVKLAVASTERQATLLNVEAFREYQTFISVMYVVGTTREYATGPIFTLATPPSPARNVRVKVTGSTTATVTWDAPLHPNGILRPYVVDCYAPGGNWSNVGTRSATNTSLTAEVKRMRKNFKYECLVKATNRDNPFDAGGESISERSPVVTTWPTDSQELAVVKAEKAVGGGITFTWGGPFLNDPEIHSFEVRAEQMNSDTPVEPVKLAVSSTERQATLLNVEAFREYQTFFTVVYLVGTKREYATGPIFTLATPPSSATNVRVKVTGSTTATVTWDAPLHPNGILRPYVVDCYAPGDNWSNVGTRSATNTSLAAEVKQMRSNFKYECLVKATNRDNPFDAGGESISDRSPVVTTWPGIMSQVLPVSAKVLTTDSVRITWRLPDTIEGICGGFQVNITSYTTGLETIYNHDCETQNIVIETKEFNSQYAVVIRGWIKPNEEGNGGGLNIPSYPKIFKTWPGQPSVPRFVSLKPVNSTAVEVNWKMPTETNGDLKHYAVTMKTTQLGTWEQTVILSPVNLMYTFGGFKPYTLVFVAVVAETNPNVDNLGGGPGVSSAVVEARTLETAPDKVTGLKCSQSPVGSPHLACRWEAPLVTNGIIRYYDISLTNAFANRVVFRKTTTATSIVIDENLNFEHRYQFSVSGKTISNGPFVSSGIKLTATKPPPEVVSQLAPHLLSPPLGGTPQIDPKEELVLFLKLSTVPIKEISPITAVSVVVNEKTQNKIAELIGKNYFQYKYNGTKSFEVVFLEFEQAGTINPLEDTVFVLGTDKGPILNTNSFNGPLNPNTNYAISIRLYTSIGYAETLPIRITTAESPSTPVTDLVNPSMPDSSLSNGAIAGITISLIVVAIAALIITVMFIRRRSMKLQLEVDLVDANTSSKT